MRYFILLAGVCIGAAGCMFVSGSYVPVETGTGYEVEGTCVGIDWDQCLERAEVLCAEVGRKVSSQMRAGGPENQGKIAIVPKKISILCE